MLRKTPYLIVLFGLFFGANIANAGFGVSPGQVKENKLVPGSKLENIIYLVQGNPEVDLTVRVMVESNEAKDWFSFSEGEEFIIPAGIQQFPLHVKVQVPEDADLGIYKAFVRVNTVPKEGNTDGQVSISLGGRIDYELTVGDNIIEEYSISSIEILDIKQNQNPKVLFKIKNTGNVSAAPAAASFELFNKFGTVRLGFVEVDEFEKVPSFSEETQELEFPIDIKFAVGEYWADVKVHDDSGKIIGNMRTVFNVNKVTLFEIIFSMAWKILLGLGILALIFWIYKIWKKKTQTAILS